jgi:hypothetical protein
MDTSGRRDRGTCWIQLKEPASPGQSDRLEFVRIYADENAHVGIGTVDTIVLRP